MEKAKAKPLHTSFGAVIIVVLCLLYQDSILFLHLLSARRNFFYELYRNFVPIGSNSSHICTIKDGEIIYFL